MQTTRARAPGLEPRRLLWELCEAQASKTSCTVAPWSAWKPQACNDDNRTHSLCRLGTMGASLGERHPGNQQLLAARHYAQCEISAIFFAPGCRCCLSHGEPREILRWTQCPMDLQDAQTQAYAQKFGTWHQGLQGCLPWPCMGNKWSTVLPLPDEFAALACNLLLACLCSTCSWRIRLVRLRTRLRLTKPGPRPLACPAALLALLAGCLIWPLPLTLAPLRLPTWPKACALTGGGAGCAAACPACSTARSASSSKLNILDSGKVTRAPDLK